MLYSTNIQLLIDSDKSSFNEKKRDENIQKKFKTKTKITNIFLKVRCEKLRLINMTTRQLVER